MAQTMVTRTRVQIGSREAELVASCALLPHGAGIGGLVVLELPLPQTSPDILGELGIPASDDGGVVAVPVARWWQWSDTGGEDVQDFDDAPLRLIVEDFFARPAGEVRRTAMRLALEVLHRSFADDLAVRHGPAVPTHEAPALVH
jgi:hypothetical protein